MGTALLPELTWIVCHGRTLQVEDGLISCPLRGRVSPDLCVTCHYLQTVDSERDPRLACDAEGVRRVSLHRIEIDRHLEAALVTDLLDDEPMVVAAANGVVPISARSSTLRDPVPDLIGTF
jgi:hypothetical protein